MNVRVYKVTGNQERYLLAERFTEASYPIPFSYQVSGALNLNLLREAILAVASRHDILRASFRSADGGFVAEISPSSEIDFRADKLPGADGETVRKHVANFFAGKLAELRPRAFVRALVVSTAENAHLVTFSLHHAIGDGVSMEVFCHEIMAVYRGEDFTEAAQSYFDVIAAPQAQWREEDRVFWLQALANIDTIPSLRPDLDDPEAEPGELTLDYPFTKLSQLAHDARVTPFSVLAAATNLVLARFCGTPEMLVTFQSAGRRGLEEGARAIGPFSNTLPLRTVIMPSETFVELATRVSEGVREAVRHERYPYHLTVRESGVQPRFGINWFPATARLSAPELEFSDREFLFYDSNYDLNIRFVETGTALRLLIHYDACHFSAERIKMIAAQIVSSLDAAAARPTCAVSELLPSPRPFAPIVPAVSHGERLFDAFLEQAERQPNRVALVGPEGSLTYAQVDRASAGLAAALAKEGVGTGARVAILAERGLRHVCAMLGILRTGATMVPLDSAYPDDRLQKLIGLSRPDIVVLFRKGDRPQWLPEGIPFIIMDAANEALIEETDPALLAAGDADNAAYMLFTSGSTGDPKCIATSHGPVLNFLRWQRAHYGLTADDRFTNLCGLAHDMMIRDVFAPLSLGAQLVIPAQETIFRPGALLDWCIASAPTIAHMTPAMGKLLTMARKPGHRLDLRLIFFGGDRLTPEVANGVAQLAPDAQLVNFYGTTETPQAAAFHACELGKRWQTYPIGHGIDEFDLHIVDEDRRPVPDGAPGEIAVRSPHLSLGYVVEGSIKPHADPSTYYTGDVGFVLPDGEIYLVGRNDDQVSIRGYRIELGEIAAALREHAGVKDALVLQDKHDPSSLVAFAAGIAIDGDDLYAWLSRKLPHYMVPAVIHCLDALPLLPNGKVDRQALLALPPPQQISQRLRGPETALERQLVDAWSAQLGRPVSPEQSFAELRGDSLSYIQVFLATEELVGELPDNWETTKLEDLAVTRAHKRSWFRWIETALAIRAASIFFVVTLHLHFFSIGGGATSALFVVSGFLIGKVQLREVLRHRSLSPLKSLTWRVFVPTILFTTSLFAAKLFLGKPVNLSVLLLYSDFVDYSTIDYVAEGHVVYLWYVCAFIHIMLLIMAVAWLLFRIKREWSPLAFASTIFAIALPLKFLLPGLIDPDFFRSGVQYMSRVGFLPTSHMATLVLGICIGLAESSRQKMIWLLLGTAFAIGNYWFVPTNSYLIVAAATAALLYVTKFPIPSQLHRLVLILSGSSLFIYLTHGAAAEALKSIGVPGNSILLVPLAISVGVAAWFVWQKVSPIARKISPI